MPMRRRSRVPGPVARGAGRADPRSPWGGTLAGAGRRGVSVAKVRLRVGASEVPVVLLRMRVGVGGAAGVAVRAVPAGAAVGLAALVGDAAGGRAGGGPAGRVGVGRRGTDLVVGDVLDAVDVRAGVRQLAVEQAAVEGLLAQGGPGGQVLPALFPALLAQQLRVLAFLLTPVPAVLQLQVEAAVVLVLPGGGRIAAGLAVEFLAPVLAFDAPVRLLPVEGALPELVLEPGPPPPVLQFVAAVLGLAEPVRQLVGGDVALPPGVEVGEQRVAADEFDVRRELVAVEAVAFGAQGEVVPLAVALGLAGEPGAQALELLPAVLLLQFLVLPEVFLVQGAGAAQFLAPQLQFGLQHGAPQVRLLLHL